MIWGAFTLADGAAGICGCQGTNSSEGVGASTETGMDMGAFVAEDGPEDGPAISTAVFNDLDENATIVATHLGPSIEMLGHHFVVGLLFLRSLCSWFPVGGLGGVDLWCLTGLWTSCGVLVVVAT